MKAVRIRSLVGTPVGLNKLVSVCNELERRFEKAGFVSKAQVTDSFQIKIGLRMCSFRINTAKLGPNADFSTSGRMCKAGFRRTNIPTWSQRETYNHIVNDVFDKFKLNARIYNSVFEIRNFERGRVNSWPTYQASERVTHEIISMDEVERAS